MILRKGKRIVADPERANRLALEILTISRNTILMNLRFLDSALSRLTYTRWQTDTIATDGDRLVYNKEYLFRAFREGRENVSRDHLHLLLHCIFRHMYIHNEIDKEIWDLACDIAVENIINDLNIPSFTNSRASKQTDVIRELKEAVPSLTAERIYRYFTALGMSRSSVKQMRILFYADSHTLWYKGESDSGEESGQADKGDRGDGGGDSTQNENADTESDTSNKGGKGEGSNSGNESEQQDRNETNQEKDNDQNDGPDSGDLDEPDRDSSDTETESEEDQPEEEPEDKSENEPEDSSQDEYERSKQAEERAKAEKEWKDISEKVRKELENFSKYRGSRAGSMIQNLSEVNRERYDYEAFLRKFAVLGEAMKVSDEEFDYIFYTYGLTRYGNLPLVEPLEYKDVRRIREFVIAIDTSGSVSGKLVQAFIRKTWNILMQSENFHRRINLHIIQCDADIQCDTKITGTEEMESLLKDFRITGLGGTDFRPVFSYVEELREKHELNDLRGLIYFTDGYGAFPAKMPDYQTAFVFLEGEDQNTEVPPWAIRLILPEDELVS